VKSKISPLFFISPYYLQTFADEEIKDRKRMIERDKNKERYKHINKAY
jgi:hypothetical protein